MTYRLNPEVCKIKSPILLRGAGADRTYSSGAELEKEDFSVNYIINSIEAEGSIVIITVSENLKINAINWIGEEAVSFF